MGGMLVGYVKVVAGSVDVLLRNGPQNGIMGNGVVGNHCDISWYDGRILFLARYP
jgi:hypothetical protein